jgi:hypothetical protein
MASPKDKEIENFRRWLHLSYLDRKLRTYAQWAPVVALRWKSASAEDLYHDYRKTFSKMDEEEFKRPERERFRFSRQQQQEQYRPFPPIGAAMWDLLQQLVPKCTYLNGLQANIGARHQIDVSDVGGGSTCPVSVVSTPGSQIGIDANLYDVAKAWRPDEMDIAYVDTELRVDLPAAPCDGFYMWFTVVHLSASTWFGNLDSGASDVSFGYRSDLGIGANAPFALPTLTPQVQFSGPDTDYIPNGAVDVSGAGTWETSFDVSQVLPIHAGEAPVVRFYTRGIAAALDGRTHLSFGAGVFDSWAIHSGAGFNDTVRGVRYLTFPPSGFGGA